MLSDNDQISLRQIKRGMLFDLFGMGSLLLPSRLASYPGSTGIWGILAAVLFTGIWLWIVNGIVRQMKPDA